MLILIATDFCTAIPPSPGLPMVTIFSESSLNVSWSPPSGPVEGGVGGYEFSVTGEGCGCVSMNVSSDTTSVTCSGWTAAGQTCSFEVQTLSRDCRFISDPNSIIFTGKYCKNNPCYECLSKVDNTCLGG